MSRLKKIANGSPDPFLGTITEELVTKQSPNEDKSDAFLLAKELIAALPVAPSNSITYALAEALSEGAFGPIDGDTVDFGALLKGAQDFLKNKGVLASKKKG